MRALLIGDFFLITVLAALPVLAAGRLQREYHRPWLSPCTADLVVRDVTGLIGLPVTDVAISLVQVGAHYPALIWMRRFLAPRALARLAEPLPANLKADLLALGLSAREAVAVEHLLAGLSHKEIGERLFIAPETVKKHTYNAHRKLGVQNRVQLSYFVQNRVARRG